MPANTIQIYCGISVDELGQSKVKKNLSIVAEYIPDYTSRRRASAGLALLHLIGTPNAAAWAAFFQHCIEDDPAAFVLRMYRNSSRFRTAVAAALKFETELEPAVAEAEAKDKLERDHLPPKATHLVEHLEAAKNLAERFNSPGPAPWESSDDEEQ